MERFWNIVHYFIYRAQCRFGISVNKVSPMLLINQLPIMKRRFHKSGIKDPMKEINKILNDPEAGISIMWAESIMCFLTFLIFCGIAVLYSAFRLKYLNLQLIHYIVLISMSLLVNYLLLFRHDKYLRYFKEFDKMQKEEREKWAWISFMVVLSILLFIIGSFVVLSHQYHSSRL